VLPRTEDGICSCRFIPVYKHAADADRPADPSKPQHHPRGPVNVYLLDCRRDSVARLAYLVRHSIALANRGLPGEWGLYPACAVRRGDYVGAYLGRVLFINPKVRWGSVAAERAAGAGRGPRPPCRAAGQSRHQLHAACTQDEPGQPPDERFGDYWISVIHDELEVPRRPAS
jgi:hypothetical protein